MRIISYFAIIEQNVFEIFPIKFAFSILLCLFVLTAFEAS